MDQFVDEKAGRDKFCDRVFVAKPTIFFAVQVGEAHESYYSSALVKVEAD